MKNLGAFLLNLLLNLFLNFEGIIVCALVFCVCAFTKISFVWFYVSVALFAVSVILRMALISFGNSCSKYTKETKNVNPYSKKTSDFINKGDNQ